MPYYIIDKQPVFLPESRERELRLEALKGKSATNVVLSEIAGTKEGAEADELIYQALKAKYAEDPDQFHEDWVHFDLVGRDASDNVWDLLYDYCHYYGCGYLSDLRDFSQQLMDQYFSDPLRYPMGKVFSFNHFVPPRKWWWKYVRRTTGRMLRLVIVTEHVRRLTGELTDFVVQTTSHLIRCAGDMNILPLLSQERSEK